MHQNKRARYNDLRDIPDSLQRMVPVVSPESDHAELSVLKTDPFRKFYLDQVQFIIEKEPSIGSLHDLLRMSTPEITLEKIKNEIHREKAFKLMKLRIHPDKHPDSVNTATRLFQEVQMFFERCCDRLETTEFDKLMEHSSDKFPSKFRVHMQWTFLGRFEPTSATSILSEKDLARLMACRCINARGAIAHGKQTGLVFDIHKFSESSVEEIFSARCNGFKVLSSIDEIKTELMTRGPIVSTSFRLSQGFAGKAEYSSCFLMSQTGKAHPLLIVGWKFTKFGDVWVVNHLDDSQDHVIAFGHFMIDHKCLAPVRTFENDAWQPGPYFEFDFSNVLDWRKGTSITFYVNSSQLESLVSCFDSGIVAAVQTKASFELCDQNKKAHSRTCALKELQWDHEVTAWKVWADFID